MTCRWCGGPDAEDPIAVEGIGLVPRCIDRDECRARAVARRKAFIERWTLPWMLTRVA